MNSLERLIREINIFIDNSLDFLENPTFRILIILFLALYSTVLIPMLNDNLNKIFNNNIVKLIIFGLIIYIGTKDPVISILIACSYILSLLQFNNTISEIPDINEINETKEIKHKENDINQNEYNDNSQSCLNQCTRTGNIGNDNLEDQCTPISAFNNELNAQGFNCPMGSDNITNGSPF